MNKTKTKVIKLPHIELEVMHSSRAMVYKDKNSGNHKNYNSTKTSKKSFVCSKDLSHLLVHMVMLDEILLVLIGKKGFEILECIIFRHLAEPA